MEKTERALSLFRPAGERTAAPPDPRTAYPLRGIIIRRLGAEEFIMKITDGGACCRIASKIKEIRGGNRLMANHDLNMTVTFYRRDEPDTKVGVVKMNGGCDFSLLDAGIAVGILLLCTSILGAVRSVLRRI